MSLVSTEIIQNVERLAAYVPEWRALWRRSANATPFQSPDWLLPWWDVFAPGELRCIAVRRGGSLAALAPLYREDGTHGARLLPVGVSLSDYLDVLIDPAYPDSVNELSGAIAEMVDVDAARCAPAPTRFALQHPMVGKRERQPPALARSSICRTDRRGCAMCYHSRVGDICGRPATAQRAGVRPSSFRAIWTMQAPC
jgi:hypothetical protein